jgi:hypothetical protein
LDFEGWPIDSLEVGCIQVEELSKELGCMILELVGLMKVSLEWIGL